MCLLILGIASTSLGKFQETNKENDHMWFSASSWVQQNQELAQIRLYLKIQFKFDLEK